MSTFGTPSVDPTRRARIKDTLAHALADAELEIRRLHTVHAPHHAGLPGEPDLGVADRAAKALSEWRNDHAC